MTKAELVEQCRGELERMAKALDSNMHSGYYVDGYTDALADVGRWLTRQQDESAAQDDHRLDALRYALGPKPQQVPQKGKDGMLYPEFPMPVQQEPSPLEVALRLIESGKCPAIPTQARDMAFDLISSIRAEEVRRAGK